MENKLIKIDGIEYLIVEDRKVIEALFGRHKLFAICEDKKEVVLIVFKETISVVDNGLLIGIEAEELKSYMLSVLKDTVNYYSVAPYTRRCVGNKGCKYSPLTIGKSYEDSEGCAVGRLFSKESALKIDEESKTWSDSTNIYNVAKKQPSLLLEVPEILILTWFFSQLQYFHDTLMFWDEKGMTVKGAYFVEKLKLMINSNILRYE